MMTLKSDVLKSLHHLAPVARFVQPIVASAKSPFATCAAVTSGYNCYERSLMITNGNEAARRHLHSLHCVRGGGQDRGWQLSHSVGTRAHA